MSHVPKAYSYLRCSTPEQMRGDSFRRQAEAAARYAKENGLALDDTLNLRDEGVSAFKGANRGAGLGRFLTAVEDGLVPVGSFLLVENLDRISRQTVLRALGLLQEIVEAGITVVTLSDRAVYSLETLDRNPGSLMMALVVMMRAHEESALKSARIFRAWEAKRKRALDSREAMTKRCPAWLRIEDDRYVEIPERADIVREIYRRAIAGEGKRSIVTAIRERGVLPWGRGRVWHESYIEKILRSEATIGRYAPLKGRATLIEGYFPATVSEDTFWAAQAARANRRTSKITVPPGKGRNLFTGLARCECGVGMHYVDKGTRSSGPYLVCGDYRTGGKCQNGLKWVYNLMERELVYFACLARERFAPNDLTVAALNDERMAARERHDEISRRLARLTDAIAAGAGASLATAHAAADLELSHAKAALAAAETAARAPELDAPLPNEMFDLLWADPSPLRDPEWRRTTAANLRRRLAGLEFRSLGVVAIAYPPDKWEETPILVPFEDRYFRRPGEIFVEHNAGWFDGRRDERGKPTKQGRIEAESSA